MTIFCTVIRLILGLVWLVAGFSKLGDLESFYLTVITIQLPPFNTDFYAKIVAYTIPWLELLLGFYLLACYCVRPAMIMTAMLYSLFTGVIAYAWYHKLNISCGCFSEFYNRINYSWHIALLIVAIIMVFSYLKWAKPSSN